MSSVVLYASHKCLTTDSQPIRVGKSIIWIRVEEFGPYADNTHALDHANPLPEEMVLNSVEKTVLKFKDKSR